MARSPGVSTSLSVLVTVLLLVSGLLIVTMVSQIVLAGRLLELRRAGEVAAASSEALQAYVYRDVNTNRTLLTLRNSGKEALEITDIMVVDGGGGVVKLLKLDETIKLGPQQSLTRYLSEILGLEYDRYDDVRSSIASLYFKTFRGRVFGSMYLAPSSIEVAAYLTSATAVTSHTTSTEQVSIPTTSETVATATVTAIIDNPSHWPVEAYVGVAFPRTNRIMDGFPEWGWSPGLNATDQNNRVRSVSPSDLKLPRFVACYAYDSSQIYDENGNWRGRYEYWRKWTGSIPIHRYSDVGPTYIAVEVSSSYGGLLCVDERFFPRGAAKNLGAQYQYTTTTQTTGTTTTVVTTSTLTSRRFTTITTTITRTYTSTSTYTTSATLTLNNITLPRQIEFRTDIYYSGNPNAGCPSYPCYYQGYNIDVYRLVYIKAVDLWNTSNVLALFDVGGSGSGNAVFSIVVDRPTGIAAVYVYSHTIIWRPPPPPPRSESEGETKCFYGVNICDSFDGDKITLISGGAGLLGPCNMTETPTFTLTFRSSATGEYCGVFALPGPGTYSRADLERYRCPQSGDTITCTVPAGTTLIRGCAQPKSG